MAWCNRGSADDIGNAGDNNLSTVIVVSTTMATAAMKVVLVMAATVALLKKFRLQCNWGLVARSRTPLAFARQILHM